LCVAFDLETKRNFGFSDIEVQRPSSTLSDIEAMSLINASTTITTATSIEGEIFSFLVAARTELLLFVVAIVAYFLLFMQRTPKNSKIQAKQMKVVEYHDHKEDEYPTDVNSQDNAVGPEESAKVEKVLRSAFDSGDYRVVLQCWSTMKKFEKMPRVSLSHVVESMQRFKKDQPFILREMRTFLKKFPQDDMTCINELLESLAKRLDSDLMEKIVDMLPCTSLEMDERSYEILLNMYFTTRSFEQVRTLVSQMKAKRMPFTTRSAMTAIKTALKMSNLDEALLYFRELKNTWTAGGLASSPSAAPAQVVSQLVELACKEHKLGELFAELRNMTVSAEVINSMLLECVKQKDIILTQRVEKFAREQEVSFTDATFGLLMRGMAADPNRVQQLFDEVVEKRLEVTPDFVSSVLALCAQTSNLKLAEQLYSYKLPTQLPVLSAFIRFFVEKEQFEKACDIYEQGYLGASQGTTSPPLPLDARTERSLMNAALKCGRAHLAQNLLSAAPSDIAKHITMIRSCAAERNLEGAVNVFKSLEQSGIDLNSVIYNTVLDACVECRDLGAAEAWMEQTKKAGMVDVVSFNTLIKAHLQNGNFDKARSLLGELKQEGLSPNPVTFNELINALVTKGGDSRRKEMWAIVDEMNSMGVKPNQVTISILLKNLNSYSGEKDISNTMDLINTMDEPMDEVLLSSVVEACVRIGKADLLSSKLKMLQGKTATISGSHTYGSLIKAYGYAKDIDGVWHCWKEMRSRHIKPTSITLGCMIEAIVGNGDTEGAYDLVHQVQEDDQCRGVLNSVIYCSVLKGFTREKKLDRVWSVYQEMHQRGIELSVILYNTLIDACARSGRMDKLPQILEDMKTHHAKPNVITYSTMLKGHCQSGDIQTAFAILEEMKKDGQLKPDEIMYNSLLDGCAQNNLVDEGLRLLEEMQSEGVRPSNFTLSILVKLMNRARKLEQAFSIVETITKKYNFRPNVHVYTNLVQACCSNQQFNRGVGILEQMIVERVVPDNRTYAILVRACMSKGLYEQASGLMRGALGVQGALPFLQQSTAACPNLDPALVNETLAGLASRGRAQDLAVPLLSDIRQGATWCRIDAATQRQVMSPCLTSNSLPAERVSKGKGKGSRDRW